VHSRDHVPIERAKLGGEHVLEGTLLSEHVPIERAKLSGEQSVQSIESAERCVEMLMASPTG
jgi:hypothetical protein